MTFLQKNIKRSIHIDALSLAKVALPLRIYLDYIWAF